MANKKEEQKEMSSAIQSHTEKESTESCIQKCSKYEIHNGSMRQGPQIYFRVFAFIICRCGQLRVLIVMMFTLFL